MLSAINLNKFHYNINSISKNRYVEIKAVGEVEEENTHGQIHLEKLENLITVDYKTTGEMTCLE